MKFFLPLVMLLSSLGATLQADERPSKKVYECRYMEDAPYGVTAWEASEMVKSGSGKESRFVPYNSAAAQGLILDATADRDVSGDPELQDHETSFYMVYNSKGWYIYIHCQEPEIESFVDERKEISLELYFSPGLSRVPYYQMMVRQLSGQVHHYDWGMPHRHFRSLSDSIKVESLPLETGVGTAIFVPWEPLYDQLPLKNDTWRFSLMRWGPSVTWGGKVHDIGNFGQVHFQPPTAENRVALQRRLVRAGWFNFLATAKAATTLWSDEEMGDLDFYESSLKPAIERQQALGESLGEPKSWNAASIQQGMERLEDWMEFHYHIAELRSQYLLDKRFAPHSAE
ncbi:MAG: hypothetical protein KDA45_08620 [Planctomycetales bacterium]|nr:hypothetical protein [Planctomycetales bacterium]